MSTQVSSEPLPAVPVAWVRLLRAHAALTREMDARLRGAHGLTLTDYEVLVALANAEEGQLSRAELAARVLLSASGVTRLLEGLEGAGLVERASCPRDGRVVYASLTAAGRERVLNASKTHLRDVGNTFFGRFSEKELAWLAELLGRLPQQAEESETREAWAPDSWT